MQVQSGRIQMTSEEHDAVEQLLGEHGRDGASLSRRDPGETGPVVVQAGGKVFHVDGSTVEEV